MLPGAGRPRTCGGGAAPQLGPARLLSAERGRRPRPAPRLVRRLRRLAGRCSESVRHVRRGSRCRYSRADASGVFGCRSGSARAPSSSASRSNVRGDLGASLTNEPLSRSRGSVDRTDRGAARSLAGVPSGDWRRRHTAYGQPHLISSSPGVQQARRPNAEPCVVQRRDRRVTPAETAILAL